MWRVVFGIMDLRESRLDVVLERTKEDGNKERRKIRLRWYPEHAPDALQDSWLEQALAEVGSAGQGFEPPTRW